jgi:hypothetical protein
VVLIIDALNQLEDREGALDLVWLPPVIPPNVRLILSTLPGRPLNDLTKRGWPTLTVAPLEEAERRDLIKEYLAQYTKELSPRELALLAGAPACANPLYLRALLEELRVYGDHHTLKACLDHYLTAPGVKELYELILARYEADYQRDRPNLVVESMSLLAAARRGLSQAELLDLLGQDGEPLPGAVWSPLFLAAEQALLDRAGLLHLSPQLCPPGGAGPVSGGRRQTTGRAPAPGGLLCGARPGNGRRPQSPEDRRTPQAIGSGRGLGTAPWAAAGTGLFPGGLEPRPI